MSDIGKSLILLGVAICVIGAIVWLMGRAGFRRLPGDVSYQGQNIRFYFPIVTCIAISLLLTAAMWLWRWLSGR